MAARSAELMKFSAKLFASRCNNVLITDLTWPAYQQILERERKDATLRTTALPLRHAILRDRIAVPDVIDRIANEYVQCRCDGLFLPLVDNLGVHLPIQEIIQRIRSLAPIEFVVVDGAQSFGHVPLSLRDGYCDLFLAGCHKWLRAFYPLGLAFFGREESRGFISDSYRTWLENGELSDPLLGFCEELQSRHARAYGETVLLAPLLTASAAAADVSWRKFPKVDAKARAGVTEAAIKNGWKPVAPVPEMESQILLFESRLNRFREYRPTSADKIKERFLEHRIALSAYDSGLVRIAFEDSSFSSDYFDWLAEAFADCLQMELEATEVSPKS
ncbi:MAG: aminotransferase class V-fold PLP-dependent enzyme [Pirellulaceae bacterium]|nr:aminotransferase class V-fold PLP-dependent enzyme [Pirellulaceae bacterium]